MVLVVGVDSYGRVAGSPQEPEPEPQPSLGRDPSHGGLCVDPRGSLRFFFAAGMIIRTCENELITNDRH